MTINDFVESKKQLFWSTRSYNTISREAIVETVLNYGDFTDVQELLSIMGTKEVSDIFFKQINQPRVNYSPKVANYFSLFFKHYA